MMSGKTNLAALAPGGFPPERIVLPSPSPGLQSSHYHACTALPLKCAAPTHPSANAPCLALLRSGTRSSRGCSRRSRSGFRRGPAQRSGAVVLADRDKPARHCNKQQCHTPLAARTGPPPLKPLPSHPRPLPGTTPHLLLQAVRRQPASSYCPRTRLHSNMLGNSPSLPTSRIPCTAARRGRRRTIIHRRRKGANGAAPRLAGETELKTVKQAGREVMK